MTKVPEEAVKKTKQDVIVTSYLLMPNKKSEEFISYKSCFAHEIFDIIKTLGFDLWKFYKIVAIKESTEETKVRTFTIQDWIRTLELEYINDKNITGKPDEIENTKLGIFLHVGIFSAHINNWKII